MVESGCTRGGADNVAESAYVLRVSDRSPGSDPGLTPVTHAGCNRIATADCRDVMDLARNVMDLAAWPGGHV